MLSRLRIVGHVKRVGLVDQPTWTTRGVHRLRRAGRGQSDRLELLVLLLGTGAATVWLFLKHMGDVDPQTGKSLLSDWSYYYENMGGVHASRVAGNWIFEQLARLIQSAIGIRSDIRLHPLRLSAVITTTFWLCLPCLVMRRYCPRFDWRLFAAVYGSIGLLSQNTFKPYDLSSLALITCAMLAFLGRRFLLCGALIAVGTLFRESTLHVVTFAVAAQLFRSLRAPPLAVPAFAAAWALPMWALRSHNDVERGVSVARWISYFASPTVLNVLVFFACLAMLYCARFLRRRDSDSDSELEAFFLVHVLVIPAWLIFYACNGGNISEFRMLLPVALPVVLGAAYRGAPIEQRAHSLHGGPQGDDHSARVRASTRRRRSDWPNRTQRPRGGHSDCAHGLTSSGHRLHLRRACWAGRAPPRAPHDGGSGSERAPQPAHAQRAPQPAHTVWSIPAAHHGWSTMDGRQLSCSGSRP